MRLAQDDPHHERTCYLTPSGLMRLRFSEHLGEMSCGQKREGLPLEKQDLGYIAIFGLEGAYATTLECEARKQEREFLPQLMEQMKPYL